MLLQLCKYVLDPSRISLLILVLIMLFFAVLGMSMFLSIAPNALGVREMARNVFTVVALGLLLALVICIALGTGRGGGGERG